MKCGQGLFEPHTGRPIRASKGMGCFSAAVLRGKSGSRTYLRGLREETKGLAGSGEGMTDVKKRKEHKMLLFLRRDIMFPMEGI